MPKQSSLRDLSIHIFQKYSEIRNKHLPSVLLEDDLCQINDNTFIYIHLLTNCNIHYNSLYKLLNIFKYDPTYSFSNIIKNPYIYVTLPDNILSYEIATDIMRKYNIPIVKVVQRKAWIYDFILFKRNEFYIKKTYLEYKYKEFFNEDFDEFSNLCKYVQFDKTKYCALDDLYNIETTMGDTMIELFYNKFENKCNATYISHYENEHNITFTKKQKQSIQNAINYKFSVICGFPGTGKSTIADCICNYYSDQVLCLTAPTGMAVNNLKNKCKVKNCIVGTLHKLLFDIFENITSKPSIMIIDEFSMVDNVLFQKVLQWCKIFECKVVLLADKEQLPPIGGGYPLEKIISSKLFKVTFLTSIKRQQGHLKNVILKMSNNTLLSKSDIDKKSVYFYNYSLDNLKKLIEKHGLTCMNTQVISPQHKYDEGTLHINNDLQNIYSNKTDYLKPKLKRNIKIYSNDLLVRTNNNYSDKELFANGDIAIVTRNTEHKENVDISYIYNENNQKNIAIDELYDEFNLAYCMTVHKVQGSQYDNIVLIISNNHEYSWTNHQSKKLLYTAISRAKQKCFILGDSKLFYAAQKNADLQKKSKFLCEFDSYEF